MKYWYGIFLNLLLTISMTAQVNNSIIVKSIDMNLVDEVIIMNEGNIKYESWDKSYGRVLVSVTTDGMNSSELKHLIRSNRYKMSSEMVGGMMYLSFPNLEQNLQNELSELIEIKCYVPNEVIPSGTVNNIKSVELIF
jgi:hypothetical protein